MDTILVMTAIQLEEVKARFSRYLDLVKHGEIVVVYDGDKAVAEIRPPEETRPAVPRPIGLAEGVFSVPKSFFDTLPSDLLAAFGGEE